MPCVCVWGGGTSRHYAACHGTCGACSQCAARCAGLVGTWQWVQEGGSCGAAAWQSMKTALSSQALNNAQPQQHLRATDQDCVNDCLHQVVQEAHANEVDNRVE